MPRVAVGRENRDFVAPILQPHGGVDDEAFGAADAQVRVEKDDVFARGHAWKVGGCMCDGRLRRRDGFARDRAEKFRKKRGEFRGTESNLSRRLYYSHSGRAGRGELRETMSRSMSKPEMTV